MPRTIKAIRKIRLTVQNVDTVGILADTVTANVSSSNITRQVAEINFASTLSVTPTKSEIRGAYIGHTSGGVSIRNFPFQVFPLLISCANELNITARFQIRFATHRIFRDSYFNGACKEKLLRWRNMTSATFKAEYEAVKVKVPRNSDKKQMRIILP